MDDKGSDDSLEWLTGVPRSATIACSWSRCRKTSASTAPFSPECNGARESSSSVMDADLQDPPEAIPRLAAALGTDDAVVFARRVARHQSRGRHLTGRLFKRFLRTGCRQPGSDGHRDVLRGVTTSRRGRRRTVCRCALCSTAAGSDRCRHERDRSRKRTAARQSLCLYRVTPPRPRARRDPSGHRLENGPAADAIQRCLSRIHPDHCRQRQPFARQKQRPNQRRRAERHQRGSRAHSPSPFRSIPRACRSRPSCTAL